MLTSMTGFGRAETDLPGSGRAVVEIRSVNHRFLEVDCRLPEGLQAFEEGVRGAVARAMARGQVRVSVSFKGSREPAQVVFKEQVARRYQQQLEALRRRLKIQGPVTLEMLLNLPQVISLSDAGAVSSPALGKKLEQVVASAVSEAVKMRKREGARLEKALRQRVSLFEELTRQIRKEVPAVQEGLKTRLAERIQAALQQVGQAAPPEELVLREASQAVQSTDVNEELERIDSHLTALKGLLAGQAAAVTKKGEQSSPGRTLDFMAQELQREVNTLGTKLRDAAVGRRVVEFKGQIEKLREQAANIE